MNNNQRSVVLKNVKDLKPWCAYEQNEKQIKRAKSFVDAGLTVHIKNPVIVPFTDPGLPADFMKAVNNC